MTTDANKLEHIQQKFASLCFSNFFHVHYNHAYALELLKLHTLQLEGNILMLFSSVMLFLGSKFCPLLHNISLGFLSCNIRTFSQFFAAHR
jgi:hypothetical protein